MGSASGQARLGEGGGEDTAELARLVVGGSRGALGEELLDEAGAEAPDRRQVVLEAGVDDDVHAVDGADQAFIQVAVAVPDGLEFFAGKEVEPAREAEVEHDRPLVDRDLDRPDALVAGAADDAVAHHLQPLQVAAVVGGLAPVHAVRAVDLVDLAGLVATEGFVPAHAVVASDGIRGGVDAVCLLVPIDLDPAVEGVGEAAAGK